MQRIELAVLHAPPELQNKTNLEKKKKKQNTREIKTDKVEGFFTYRRIVDLYLFVCLL